MRKTHTGEAGQALIELALVMPVFIIMLVGAAELVRVAYAAIEVSNAARSAAQYGCQNGSTALDPTAMQAVASADAGNLANVNTTVAYACKCAAAGVGTSIACTQAASDTCTTGGGYVVTNLVITTSANVSPLVHLPGLPNTYTLRGYAVHEVLR
ncbi:MAG TPA: TadE/TadG family type IV pilus assembly protein [Terracidiphilus sp.]|nr:TadE/TadG family type IV pilus assembly protein [Terracidiphilus sp.]